MSSPYGEPTGGIISEGQDGPVFTDYLRADWNESLGTISPDSAKVAYVSDESGVLEVYVRSFPNGSDQIRVSDAGGSEPVWASDGSAIYYRNGTAVMRASVVPGAVFSVASPERLFEGRWQSAIPGSGTMNTWDVHPDGELFSFLREPGSDPQIGVPVIHLELVMNFFEELRQRVPN